MIVQLQSDAAADIFARTTTRLAQEIVKNIDLITPQDLGTLDSIVTKTLGVSRIKEPIEFTDFEFSLLISFMERRIVNSRVVLQKILQLSEKLDNAENIKRNYSQALQISEKDLVYIRDMYMEHITSEFNDSTAD